MFIRHNENRDGRNVGDCTVRAISTALNQTWEKTYWGLCVEGAAQADMPSSNRVWGAYPATLKRGVLLLTATCTGLSSGTAEARLYCDVEATNGYADKLLANLSKLHTSERRAEIYFERIGGTGILSWYCGFFSPELKSSQAQYKNQVFPESFLYFVPITSGVTVKGTAKLFYQEV